MSIFRILPLVLLACAPLSAQTTTITGSKDDGTPAATKKPAGSTVTYSNTITNTGANAATNLSFNDPDVTNATLVPGSIHISPLAINDTYETIANTQLTVGPSAGTGPEVYVNSNVRANDQTLNPPGGSDTSSIVSTTAPTNGTLLAIDTATGAFSYVPNPGFVGTDSFTYTLKNDADATLTDTATVSIVVKDANPDVSGNQTIWYVKNDGAAGNGRSSSPFNTLVAAQAASVAGDTIYVFTGDGNVTGQNAGVTLKSAQRLIGQGVALTVPVQVNGGALVTQLNAAAGLQPRINNTSGNGVSVVDVIPAEIRGLSISGSANAIDFTYNAAAAPVFATCQIKNNFIFSAGAEGIDINKDGNFTLGLDIQNNDWNTANTHIGNAVDIDRPAGTTQGTVRLVFNSNNLLSTGASGLNISGNNAVTITGFAGNQILGDTAGSGVICDRVVFDSDIGTVGFQQLAGGSIVVGSFSNAVGGNGIVLTNTSGDLAFTTLFAYAGGGAALRASSTAAYTGSAGLRISIGDSAGNLVANAGPSLDANTVQIQMPNVFATSNASATHGVNLVDTDGSVFTARSGSFITTSTNSATALRIDGSTGTYAFAGNITATAGKGVELTNNTGATISFTGVLNLSTAANPAFIATGGGTVSSSSTSSSLTTTTGTALNVTNTTIGSVGLRFRRVSHSGGTTAITLNNTGTSGGLWIVGDGGVSNNASGGTIQNCTGVSVSLTSTSSVSLNYLNISNGGDDGIRGNGVTGLSMNRCNVTNNGNATFEDGVDFGGTGSDTPDASLSGTVSITSCQFTGNYHNQFSVTKNTGTANITMSDCTVSGRVTENNNNDGLFFQSIGTATITGRVENSSFSANKGDHFQAAAANSGNLNVTFKSNTLSGGHSTALGQGITINAATGVPGYAGDIYYDIDGNTINSAILSAITVNLGTSSIDALFNGFIRNNVIGTAGSLKSGSLQAHGIQWEAHGRGTHTSEITNNTIREVFDRGMAVTVNDGSPVANLTITGNNFSTTANEPSGSREAVEFNLASTSTNIFGEVDAPVVRVNLSNNTLLGGVNKNGDIRMRQRFRSRVELPSYGGTPFNTAAVTTLLQANNTGATATATTNDDPSVTTDGYFGGSVPTPIGIPQPLLYAENLPGPGDAAIAHVLPSGMKDLSAFDASPTSIHSSNTVDSRPAHASRPLTKDQLQKLIPEAKARWIASGLSPEQQNALESLRFEVGALSAMRLGQATDDLIEISPTAAGNSWFIDESPEDDIEFAAHAPRIDGVDLLTTLMHEMGHRLGLPDSYQVADRRDIMFGFLPKGERRVPAPGRAMGIMPTMDATPRNLGSPITINQLPAGKSVTIKYSVTVNNDPLTWVGATLSSQASITSGNANGAPGYFPPVVTNDPESPAPDDATITLLDRPDATVVSLNRVSSSPNKEAAVTWQVIFSTPIKGLTTSNFSLVALLSPTGASITSVADAGGTGTDDTWNITVNTGSGDGALGLNLANDTGITHDITNAPFTGQTIDMDKTQPSVSLATLASNPTNTSPIPVSVTFSESVTGFTSGDITAGNATVANFAGSGASYTFDLLPSGEGSVTADIAADVVQDAAGNNNTAATQLSRTYDSVAPTVAMSSATANPTINAAIPVTVTFSETVTGFSAGQVVPGNGTVQNFAGSGASYTFDLVPSGPGVIVTADIAAAVAQDVAGNNNTAATQFSRTIVDQVSVAATTGTAVEGGATGLFTFTRNLTSGALTVNFQLDGSSTASAGTDFELSGTDVTFNVVSGAGSVVIPEGSATATVTFTALVETPNAAEAAEFARLNLASGTGYVAAAAPNDNATVNITENSFLVTTTADSGTGSLRQAVLNANGIAGADTISFSNGTGGTVNFLDGVADTITLTSGELPITQSLDLAGPSPDLLTVSRSTSEGTARFRVFNITNAGAVNLSGLTIANGDPLVGKGGGLLMTNTTMTISNCVVRGNRSPDFGGGFAKLGGNLTVRDTIIRGNHSATFGGGFDVEDGQTDFINVTSTANTCTSAGSGGLFHSGTVRMVNSSIHGNHSAGGTGGLFVFQAIATVSNTTVSGNSASAGGAGGVYVQAGTLSLLQSTITNNTSSNPGGGIQINTNGAISIGNSIVAGNQGPVAGVDVGGVFTDLGGNLIGIVDGATGFTLSTLVGTTASPLNPMLGLLANNGGPTQTHALLAGSPALNAGSNSLLPADSLDLDGDNDTNEPLPVDQRGLGFTRAIGTVDIGAFELQKSVSIANVAASNEGNSGATNFTFTITRTGDTTGEVTMTYTVGGTAVDAADFGGTLPTGTAAITDGNSTATIDVPVSGDTLVEPDEVFTVTLSDPNNGYVISGAPASSTITNDDSATLSIAKITDGAEANAPTNGKFRVTQSAASSTDTTVSYTVAGTATGGTDFTTLSGTVTIPAGSSTADIDVTVLNDGTTLEPTETVILTLGSVTGGSTSITVGTTNEATMDITDDDTATVTIAKINDGSETGPANALFRVTQSAQATEDTVITYSVGGTASSGSDFTTPSGTVTILAGQTTADIPVTITDDALVEATETVSLTLTGFTSRDSDVSLGATLLATADITDNDSAVVSIEKVNDGNEAGPENALFRVSQSAESSTDTTVTYTVGGTASAGSDFTTLSGSVTIPAGSTSADITIAVTDDAVVEATESVALTLSGFSARDADITLGATVLASANITDNDSATVTIARINDGVEAAVPTNALFRVTQTAVASVDTVVTYSVGGTATSGSDFTALSGSVTIPAGSTTADITVTVLNETIVEPTETVSLTLTGFTARDPEVTLGTTLVASADITDSDTATASIAKTTDGAEAGPVNAVFTVSLSAQSSTATTLTYTVGGTAASGSDFTAPTGSVTIPANTSSATVTVSINNDSLVEATEDISLTLTGITVGDPQISLGATLIAVAAITDNDSATVTIEKVNDGGEAGPANAVFRVTQSAQSSSDTTVTYSVGGTASSGSDFTTLSGSVTIPAGSTSADITIAVTDDAVVEATESVALTLSGFSARDADITLGATVLASANITDNDSATVTIARINDGVEAVVPTNALFRVTQTAVASVDTVVTYSVGGTATSGSDFTALSGSVTIPAGSTTADITVTVLNENVVEPTETVSLTLTGFGGRDPDVTLGATLVSSANITDSDTSVITLAAVDADQNEGTGGSTTSFTFSATLSNPVQGGFTIAYVTNDGTALLSDGDYQDNDGTLNFTGTASESKTITVLVNHDGTNEVDETFTVALGSITNTALGGSLSPSGSPQTGTIRNDDALTISIAATDAEADENTSATGTYRVSRNGVLGDVSVQLSIDASSTASASDWNQSGATFASLAPGSTGSVLIPNGQSFVDMTVTPTADIQAEAGETVRINITSDPAYVIGKPSDATVTIGQNDFVVINTNDAGEGSLRQAVQNANDLAGADDITFAGTTFTDATKPDVITLTSGQLVLSSDLRILGLGADVLHVSAGGASRVFQIPNVAANVTLDGLTVRDGVADYGGGIYNGSSGEVVVHRCVVSANSASTQGGGIYTQAGTLHVWNSTLSGNAAVHGGGFLTSEGNSVLTNATISGNSANQGGGVASFGGFIRIINTTITANSSAVNGGGLYIASSMIPFRLGNSIIAGNAAPAGADILNFSSVAGASGGGNLVGVYEGSSGVFDTGNPNGQGDYVDSTINPMLGPLQNNGGTTPTHALLPASPAVNRGVNSNLPQDTFDIDGDNDTTEILPLDQALEPRIYDNPTIPADNVDIGAMESQNSPPTVVPPGIADVNKIEDDPAFTIDLLPHFADAEQANTTLTYSVVGNTNPSLVGATTNNSTELSITPQSNQTGIADITIRVTDNGNLTVEDTFRVTITPQVDLVASVVESVDPVLAGVALPGNLQHQVRILNNGPSDATTVKVNVSQTLPAGVTLVSSSPSSGSLDSGVWTIPVIADDTMATLTLSLSVAANTAAGTDAITTTAAIDSVTEPIVSTANDSASVSTSVTSASAMPLSLTTGLVGNFQNSLLEQRIRVTNNNSGPVPAFRVVISGLPADVIVFNRQGTTSGGAPYILWNQPLAGNGGVANLLVQFHRASGIANFAPVYTIELIGAPEMAPLPGGTTPLEITRTLRRDDGSYLVEWASIPGRSYRVRWSPDLVTWYEVLPDVRAVANRTQWIDGGPPQTISHPSSVGSRFYQIHLLP